MLVRSVPGVLGKFAVVEPDDGDVVRNSHASLREDGHRGRGDVVVERDQCRRQITFDQKFAGRPLSVELVLPVAEHDADGRVETVARASLARRRRGGRWR